MKLSQWNLPERKEPCNQLCLFWITPNELFREVEVNFLAAVSAEEKIVAFHKAVNICMHHFFVESLSLASMLFHQDEMI